MTSRSRVLVVVLALAGACLVVVAVIALAANPLARRFTRQALASREGVHGTFLDARVDLLHRTYSLDRLALFADGAHPADAPFLTVERLDVHVSARDLLRGKMTAWVKVAKAKLTVRITKGEQRGPPDPGAELQGMPPLRLPRIDLRDCELLLTDATTSPGGKLWVHDVDVELKDVATRRNLKWNEAPTFAVRGVVQRSGALKGSGTLDPLASVPTFEGELHLADLQLSDLFALIAPRTGLQVSKGSVSASGTVTASGGRLRGRFQPVFSGLEIHSADGNAVKIAEGGLANAALAVIPDRFAASKPAVLDVPWTTPVALWEAALRLGQDSFEAALGSALAGEKPAPPVSRSKGTRPVRGATP